LAGTLTVPGTVATVELLLLTVTEVAMVWTALSVTVNVPVVPRMIESVAGCKLATVGAGITVKEPALVPVPASVMTAIGPVVAVGGTTATRVVALVTVKVGARTPWTVTVCTFTKFVPVTVTEVPGWPLVGAKPLTVGAGRATSTWLATLAPLSVTVTVVEPVATAVTGMDRGRHGHHSAIGAGDGERSGSGRGRGKCGRQVGGGANRERERIRGERGWLCAGSGIEHADNDETPWGTRETNRQCVGCLERDRAIEDGDVLPEVVGVEDFHAVQFDGRRGDPIRAVGIAVHHMERVGRGRAAWQRERVGKLIRRVGGACVLFRPEEHGLRERRCREG
jgi:hypothetical protein